MIQRKSQFVRLYALSAILLAVLVAFLVELFSIQIVHHDEYLDLSVTSITRSEAVTASRGIITDRAGRTLVGNRSTYSLTFDSNLLPKGTDKNEAILRLLQLCQSQNVGWSDHLPIDQTAPYSFQVDQLSSNEKRQFLSYLKSLKPAKSAISSYLLTNPELLEAVDDAAEETEEPVVSGWKATLKRLFSANRSSESDSPISAPIDRLKGSQLTNQLLLDMGIDPIQLMAWMRDAFSVPTSLSQADARLVLGVQYELALRSLGANNAIYVLADDVDVEFISILSDGQYRGAKVGSASVREIQTDYAAHLLGIVGSISNYTDELKEQGYSMDDRIGQSGVEQAFETYLRGIDGKRVVATNSEGKVTAEYYSIDPQPGNIVELTIDLKLQEATENALAETVSAMNAKDGLETRGAGAAVVKVNTGEVLSLASYPSFDLSSYRKDFAELRDDPAKPLLNRATQGAYAPGSTLKPATAIAALESGVVDVYDTVYDTGYWKYPSSTWSGGTNCWLRSGHGTMNATSAITNSCNYYFAEMGYRMGMDTLNEYLSSFGLGQSTGIEIGDAKGTLASNESGGNQAPWAAYGQANQLYTPLQLANYIATLVNGGQHRQAHLLKTVKTYDSSEIVTVGNTEPLNTIDISDSSLDAVKKGMLGYTRPGGSVYNQFTKCVVSAGAKTGTAQVGANITNNGVFVCFAPYEDPEIAVAVVIEKATAGANLASAAVEILNAYFTADQIGAVILPENTLLS